MNCLGSLLRQARGAWTDSSGWCGGKLPPLTSKYLEVAKLSSKWHRRPPAGQTRDSLESSFPFEEVVVCSATSAELFTNFLTPSVNWHTFLRSLPTDDRISRDRPRRL